MRILANENVPGPVVRALRQRGDDVAWVKEDQRGTTDEDVLARRTEKGTFYFFRRESTLGGEKQNVPLFPFFRALRQRGDDVAWVKEDEPGAADEDVLARAQTERQVLVTLDKDFGELACRRALPAACGVVLFRLTGSGPDEDNARAVAALTSRTDWAGHFAVVQNDRIRLRPLPQTEQET